MHLDQIIETQDGSHSILSHKYGVSYHSKYGAITESKHVFISAGLFPKIREKEVISILEIGFGTGLNAFLSFIEANTKKLKLNYVGIEAYPISEEQYHHLNYPELLETPHFKNQFLQLHTSEWGKSIVIDPQFTFIKHLKHFEDIDYQSSFDVIYFDAFAPSAQPELWEEDLLQKMYDALVPGGIMVTYCAKGLVKRRLKSIGFTVESLPGPPGKREMTKGIKPQ